MVLLYSFGIWIYGLAIKLASLFSPKAAKWVKGRKDLWSDLQAHIEPGRRWIWIHAASLGEFEQGRPLIERLKRSQPKISILLTFFSPSGYEVRKDYPMVDHVCYMPLDTRTNARRFVEIVNPAMAIFIKYEIWYHHLTELVNADIPTLLVSAQFRRDQVYFRWYGHFFSKVLHGIRQIFVADEASYDVLRDNGYSNMQIAGDTRIDRVIDTSRSHLDFSFLNRALASDDILVIGSSWPADEEVIIPALNRLRIKTVIAPHEIDEAHLRRIENALAGTHCRLSKVTDDTRVDHVIVDSIGDLAHIYHVASMAYVGGGFGTGIHNILEAAVFGVPVIFGPNYGRFAEANELVGLGAAHPIASTTEFEATLSTISDGKNLSGISLVLKEYFTRHEGATSLIYDYICRESMLKDELEK